MATKHADNPKALMAARRRAAKPQKRGNGGLTPRVKRAIEAIVFGLDGQEPAKGFREAAAAAGLTERALRDAVKKPIVLAYYRAELAALKEGERAANLHKLVEIRDDPGMNGSAAGRGVQIEAIRTLDRDLEQRGPSVNVGVQVNVETPGYVIDLSEYPAQPKASNSPDVIEHEPDAESRRPEAHSDA